MFSFRNLNIKNKLIAIIMIASIIAVFLAGCIFISFSAFNHRDSLARELTSLARVLGNNSKVILEFNVYEDAQKVLSTLEGRSSIVQAVIYNSKGVIISTYPNPGFGQLIPPPDISEDSHLVARGKLHVFHKVRLNEKAIGTVYLQDDMRHVYARIRRDGSILAFVMLIASATAYIVSSRLQKMISGPILSLAGIAGTVSEKRDYSIRADKASEDEVGRLIDSFNDMLSLIQQRDDALRESEGRFRSLVETTSDWIWEVDQNGVYTYASPNVRALLGYGPEEVVGKTPFDFMTEEEAGRVGQIFNEIVASKAVIENLENVNRHKDGKLVILETNAVPVLNENGEVFGYRGIDRDITDRKKAEEQIKASLTEKEVLLSEVHHRVKNNMQVITSLLKLQASKLQDKHSIDIFKESQDRIKSMALIHEKLYLTKNFANIDFRGYVKSLVTSLFRSYVIKPEKIVIKMDVANVTLDLESAIPCGLIINELVANSLKYAFPEERKGEIRITLRAVCEDEFVLEIYDNGIGLPAELDIRKTKSMGLHLVTMLSENQLEGNIELNRVEGTTFQITFKKHTYKARI